MCSSGKFASERVKTTAFQKRKERTFQPWSFHAMLTLGCVCSIVMLNGNCAVALSCYECDSHHDITCKWNSIVQSHFSVGCRNVPHAKYCLKMISVYGKEIGTKRFCSSKDYGNYCEYTKIPGADYEYRTCVYTCSNNQCNTASEAKRTSHFILLIISFIQYIWKD